MTAPMKKITWCVIYLIKVNYTSYNYTKYMDVAYVPFQVCRVFTTFSWIKLGM